MRGSVKAQLGRLNASVDRDRGTCDSARAERTVFATRSHRPKKPGTTPLPSRRIAEHPKPNAPRRGELTMCLQGKSQRRPVRRLAAGGGGHLTNKPGQLSPGIDAVHFEQRRDLIVSRSGGVNLSTRFAPMFREARFDPGVQVLVVGLRTRRGGKLLLDAIEPAPDLRRLVGRENPRGQERLGVSPLKAQLKRQQEPVLLEAAVEFCKRRMQRRVLFPQRRHRSPPRIRVLPTRANSA